MVFNECRICKVKRSRSCFTGSVNPSDSRQAHVQHLRVGFGFGMLIWNREHPITVFQEPQGVGGNGNEGNSWTQVTSWVSCSELRSQQDDVVTRTAGPRPRAPHPPLHKRQREPEVRAEG